MVVNHAQLLMPTVEALSEKYGEQLKFTKINTTKARRLAISEKVLGLPVIAIYKDGAKVDEVVKDDATAENIEAMIQENIYKTCFIRVKYL